jgi:hypothetical protein
MVSLARYLYVEDGSPFIQRGELADFLSYVAARMSYGFWGEHTRALLDARDRGVNISIVRYEELFLQQTFAASTAGSRKCCCKQAGDPVRLLLQGRQ